MKTINISKIVDTVGLRVPSDLQESYIRMNHPDYICIQQIADNLQQPISKKHGVICHFA